MRLSVIVPIYKVEDSLDRCVSSIVAQNCPATEIILVDDGSPDSCPDICDQWERRNASIRVIHKANGGLSDARNAGIQVAKGDYITFVDSDDYLSPDTYTPLMEMLESMPEADMLEYSISIDNESHSLPLTMPDNTHNGFKAYWLDSKAYQHSYAWNKIFRKELFGNVMFPVGRVFEDIHTLPQLLSHSHKIITTSRGCYHYCINSSGITTNAKGQQWTMLLDSHVSILSKWFHGNTLAEETYYMHVLNIQLYTYGLTATPPLLPNCHISHPLSLQGWIMKTKALALNILGINNLCRLYRTTLRILRLRS